MAGTALKNCFKEIADAIREKLRINTPMTPLEMPSYIDLIETREVNRPICDLQKIYEEEDLNKICTLNRCTPIIDYENDRIFFWEPGQGLYLYIFTENSVKLVYTVSPIKGITPAKPKQIFLANNTLYYIPKNVEDFIFIEEDPETGQRTYYLYYYTVKLPKDIPTYWDGAIYAYEPLWSEHKSQWAYELQQRQSYYSVPGSQYSTQWSNNCFINSSNNYAYFLMTSFRYNQAHEKIYNIEGVKIPLSTSYDQSLMPCGVYIEEGTNIYECINSYNIYLNIYNQEPVFCFPNNTLLKLDVANDNISIYTLTSFENLRDYNNNSYNPGIISEYIDNNNTKYTIKLDNCLNKLINNMWYVDMILPVFKKEYPYFMISSSDADVVLEDNFYQGSHMPSSSDTSTIRRLYHFKNTGTFCFITTKYWNKYKWLQNLIIYKIIDKEEV